MMELITGYERDVGTRYERDVGTASITYDISNKYSITAATTTGIYHNEGTDILTYNKKIKSTWYYPSITAAGTAAETNYISDSYITGTDSITASRTYTINDYDHSLFFRGPVQTPSDRMREILRSRSAPVVHRGNRRKSMTMVVDAREAHARSTLRDILGESSFRKFLRDGFISVVSKSGLTYRIYPGHGTTEVYDRGVMVETMCVVLKGNFPPTDELIMRYLLILNDEGEFSKYAVRSRMTFPKTRVLKMPKPEEKSLPELFAGLKAVA